MKARNRSIEAAIRSILVTGVLLIGALCCGPNAVAQSPGAFTATGNLIQIRAGHTATALNGGKILITGGEENTGDWGCLDPSILSDAELYDPSKGVSTITGGMGRTRVGHTATLLSTGNVLVAGGDKENLSQFTDCTETLGRPRPSAELYNATTGAFTPASDMTIVRSGHTATLLRDGRVLITGGATDTQSVRYCPAFDFQGPPGSLVFPSASAEIYDPSSGTFTATGSMTLGRYRHTATLLDDGRVLITGGAAGMAILAEIYDPLTGRFTATGIMSTDRYGHTAVLLPDGKVLVTGGSNSEGLVLSSAELYNPVTGSFTGIGNMTQSRAGHSANLLQNGTILLTGGTANGTATAERYDPTVGSFTSTGHTTSFRSFHTATVLANGDVLMTGGCAGRNSTARAEVFNPDSIRPVRASPIPMRDFDRDGKSDILWRDGAGNVSLWLVDGNGIRSDSTFANISMGWTITGTGDFNGDGKTDVLWRDTNGEVAIWLMDGATIASYASPGSVPAGWKTAGVADFNGDGKADVLWRDPAGEVVVWFMNGQTIQSSNSIANIWTGWSIVGTGDFDGDGKADILWCDVAGTVVVWLMDGAAISTYSEVEMLPWWWGKLDWTVFKVADFDGDGKSDILRRDIFGDVAIFLMDGTSVASTWEIATIWTGWTIAGTEDFNGDGSADILWRDNAGNVVVWWMDGISVSSWRQIGNAPGRMVQ